MMTPGYVIEAVKAMKAVKFAMHTALRAREHNSLMEEFNAIIEREKAAGREAARKAEHDGDSWSC